MSSPKRARLDPPPGTVVWDGIPELDIYFAGQSLDYDEDLQPFLDHLYQFFKRCGVRPSLPHRSVAVNYAKLIESEDRAWLTEVIARKPQLALNAMGLACTAVLRQEPRFRDLFVDNPTARDRLQVRLINYEPVTPLKSLKSNLVGKLICIRGTVVRTSLVRPLLLQVSFVCAGCNRRQIIKAEDGKYNKPTKCYTPGCKCREFIPERGTQGETETVDWQKIRIQEKFGDDRLDSGRVPRTVECELTHDLVDSVLPGDVVNCTGIIKVIQSSGEAGGGGRGKRAQNAMYVMYLDVVAIGRIGATVADPTAELGTPDAVNSKDAIQFTATDLRFIREIFQEPQLFRLVVNSFCPAIYGNELIKAGILLCQFGGKRRQQPDAAMAANHVPMRADPHILVVGDPGMGKSQMLTAAVHVAPRGVYVCGSSGISSCGLTVSICKDPATGDFALEAGALVLGDQGCCCIDEFDKMTSDHDALLEAMEQQSISIAKAGIVCNLPARTSVIAAANPVGGHYNKAKTVSENLKMGSALLSRFDLIFIMLDRPNLQRDAFLSHHIMAV
ncbi:hypothetical protein IWQ60_001871, partial [Tieghemiomyces parasiticus]